MRCDLQADQVAAWWSAKYALRLGTLAAAVLLDRGLIKAEDIETCRTSINREVLLTGLIPNQLRRKRVLVYPERTFPFRRWNRVDFGIDGDPVSFYLLIIIDASHADGHLPRTTAIAQLFYKPVCDKGSSPVH